MPTAEFVEFNERIFSANGTIRDRYALPAYFIKYEGELPMPERDQVFDALLKSLQSDDECVNLGRIFDKLDAEFFLISDYDFLMYEDEFYVSIQLACILYDEDEFDVDSLDICTQSVGISCSDYPSNSTIEELLDECYDLLCEGVDRTVDDLVNKTADERSTIVYL